METNVFDTFAFAPALGKDENIRLENGSNQGWPSYLIVENNANKAKYKSSFQSGMLAICLAMPQASIKLEPTTVVGASKQSTMNEVVKMANWANTVTTPTLSNLVFDWSNFSNFIGNEDATVSIPLSDNIELDFLDNESDFMHLMATNEFLVNIVVESIEEGKPNFYESDTIDFIDEPFFI